MAQHKKQRNRCLVCDVECRWVASIYCTNKCQRDYEYRSYIERWKKGLEDGVRSGICTSDYLRRYLFEKFGSKCSRCEWNEVNSFTGLIPLELHHEDGDFPNNKEENLDLLCPSCHSRSEEHTSEL